MNASSVSPSKGHDLALLFADSWGRIEQRLDRALGSIVGLSLAEYRLLRVLADSPGGEASRVVLADSVRLSASGVTRALRPLEKRRIVRSGTSQRDARLVMARLTEAGRQMVNDATAVVNDSMSELLRQSPETKANQAVLVGLLEQLRA